MESHLKFAIRIMLFAVAFHAVALVQAQSYPSKPIRIIVSYPPGGSTDIVGRTVSQKLADLLGRPVVVDNRAGASGTIGADIAAKSLPDGYTLFVAAGAHALAQSLYLKLPYDLAKDFASISLVGRSAYLLVLHPSVAAHNVKELIALAKSRPAKLNYASTGLGSTPHLAAALFCSMAGVQMTNVPYKGDAPAISDLLGGHVDLSFIGISGVASSVTAGKLRALAVTSAHRTSVLPNLPTVAEAGVPGYEFDTWWGLVAPTGTPQEIIGRLHQLTVKAVAAPDVKERFTGLGVDTVSSTPEFFGNFIKSEVDKYARIAKAAGVTPINLQ